ncbi:WD40-repeat-containing domain protein [Baffinella frigidus]|nr:WD40-repeat-containing domain protein [Cryptophyta sp. CCMP2293]
MSAAGGELLREEERDFVAMQCEHRTVEGAVHPPASQRLPDIVRGFETGSHRKPGDRAKAARNAALYLEEDIVINGVVTERTCQLPPDVRCTIAVAASFDGTLFATSHGDHAIRIFSVMSGKTVAVLDGHTRTPWTLAFHRLAPHLLVSGCLNGELRVWDVRTRKCIQHAVLGPDRVTSVAFHPERMMVAAVHPTP